MNRMNWSVLALAVGAALALGWWSGRASAPDAGSLNVQETSAESGERKILYYRNPMGLPDTSPVPKKDAMGMDYIPVFEGGEPAAEPGTVVLPPDKVQKLGVRTEVAVREALVANVRASASVQVDETRQFVVAPRFEGWIETLYANETGMTVRRGGPNPPHRRGGGGGPGPPPGGGGARLVLPAPADAVVVDKPVVQGDR